MTTLTGILEWPQRAEGRVRQLNGSSLIERDDDPVMPTALAQRYKLRNGLEVTVTLAGRAAGFGAGVGGPGIGPRAPQPAHGPRSGPRPNGGGGGGG
ncbi:MAG: hypothetical protein K2W85_00510, partial [Phycisphaerales bacterium]|nr:hypothetical protein [Phycisphaerales bacterium]